MGVRLAAGQTDWVMLQTDAPCGIGINLAPHIQLCSKPNTSSLQTIPSSQAGSLQLSKSYRQSSETRAFFFLSAFFFKSRLASNTAVRSQHLTNTFKCSNRHPGLCWTQNMSSISRGTGWFLTSEENRWPLLSPWGICSNVYIHLPYNKVHPSTVCIFTAFLLQDSGQCSYSPINSLETPHPLELNRWNSNIQSFMQRSRWESGLLCCCKTIRGVQESKLMQIRQIS